MKLPIADILPHVVLQTPNPTVPLHPQPYEIEILLVATVVSGDD